MNDGDVVLFNRQPSLHKMSIMAHHAKVHYVVLYRLCYVLRVLCYVILCHDMSHSDVSCHDMCHMRYVILHTCSHMTLFYDR